MYIRYHEPLGISGKEQDCLPPDWKNLAASAAELPENFGTVEKDKLYRSAIVWAKHIPLLHKQHRIAHYILLIDGNWLEEFYKNEEITIHQFPFLQRRELTLERVKSIVSLINSLREPSLICCLKGKTKTGMLSAGYEILNGQKSVSEAIAESIRYGNFNISSFREIRKYKI